MRACFEVLSDAETEELQSLRKTYPTPDRPLKYAFEALGRD
jgi:hypothetical protein